MIEGILLNSVFSVILLVVLATVVSGLVAVTVGLFMVVSGRHRDNGLMTRTVRLAWLSGVPFAIVGIGVGYMTGLSRESAVGALIPAALTIIGGLGIYLYGKSKRAAVLATFTILNFTILLLIGVLFGAGQRSESERMLESIDYQKHLIENDFILKKYKRGLGLEKCLPVQKYLEKTLCD